MLEAIYADTITDEPAVATVRTGPPAGGERQLVRR